MILKGKLNLGQLTEIDPDVTVVYFLLMLNFSHYKEKVNIYKEFAAKFGTRLATNIQKPETSVYWEHHL